MRTRRKRPTSPLTPKQLKRVAEYRAKLAAEKPKPTRPRAIALEAARDAEPYRSDVELRAEAKPPRQQAYTPPPAWPQTIDDLASGCGPYSDTVTAYAKALAARTWATGMDHDRGSNPASIVGECLSRYIAQLWRDIGVTGPGWVYVNLPEGEFEKRAAPVVNDLSPDCRSEAMHVVADTLAEWEAAGSPGLDHDHLRYAYKALALEIQDGTLATFEGCPFPNEEIQSA